MEPGDRARCSEGPAPTSIRVRTGFPKLESPGGTRTNRLNVGLILYWKVILCAPRQDVRVARLAPRAKRAVRIR